VERIRWPVKVLLVHPKAPFLKAEKVVIAADCAVLLRKELAEEFKAGTPVLIGCPLLEDPYRLYEKLKLIAEEASSSSFEVYTMEVPCCHAIHMMVREALEELGRGASSKHYIVKVASGEAEPYAPGHIDEAAMELERMVHEHLRGAQ